MIVMFLILASVITPLAIWYMYQANNTKLNVGVGIMGLVQGFAWWQAFICNVVLFPFAGLLCHFKSLPITLILICIFGFRIVKGKLKWI